MLQLIIEITMQHASYLHPFPNQLTYIYMVLYISELHVSDSELLFTQSIALFDKYATCYVPICNGIFHSFPWTQNNKIVHLRDNCSACKVESVWQVFCMHIKSQVIFTQS